MKRKIWILGLCALLAVVLVAGCTGEAKSENQEVIDQAQEIIDEVESEIEAQNSTQAQQPTENFSQESEEKVSEPWCNDTKINSMKDPQVTTWGFEIIFTENSVNEEMTTLLKGEDITVHLGVYIPPEHLVENLKAEMRLGVGDDYVYSDVTDFGDFEIDEKYTQGKGVRWTTPVGEAGNIKLEAKLTYVIDKEERVQCIPARKLIVLDKTYNKVSFDALNITPLEELPDPAASTRKVTFNTTLTANQEILAPGQFVGVYVFRDPYPIDHYYFSIGRTKCSGYNCTLQPVMGLDNSKRAYFCTTRRPVYLVFQIPHDGIVTRVPIKIDPRAFIEDIGCQLL